MKWERKIGIQKQLSSFRLLSLETSNNSREKFVSLQNSTVSYEDDEVSSQWSVQGKHSIEFHWTMK